MPARPLDARALAALAANPGCRRRALLDGAGVDKGALAQALGSPAPFGQSQFAFARGNAFEARVKADGGQELLRLVKEHLGTAGAAADESARVPDLSAAGPEGRVARTALALREATRDGGWTLLDHPLLALDVAGSPAYLEPDAVVVGPQGRWTVVEIKSFPMLDGSADASKVGGAARQSAVYVLALERIAECTDGASVGDRVLLVCPKDFSNLPTASVVDVRKQRAVTSRQLARLARVEDIAAALPEGTTFDVSARDGEHLTAAVESVPAAYAPDCLAACELAFHCRARARTLGAVESLGRSVRGELGGLTTVGEVLAAAHGEAGDASDPAVAALRRAAVLRTEALQDMAGALRAEARAGTAAGARAAAGAAEAGGAREAPGEDVPREAAGVEQASGMGDRAGEGPGGRHGAREAPGVEQEPGEAPPGAKGAAPCR